MLVWHGTFAINSVAHVAGRQRYVTGDDLRNNWLLAILTMGEGWHNNHHAYQSSVRQGFRWWEYDPTFYALKVLSWCGVVWDLQSPPAAVVRGEQRLGRKVIDKVRAAGRRLSDRAHRRAGARDVGAPADLGGAAVARPTGARPCRGVPRRDHLPHLPSVEEIRGFAEQRLARTVSLDDIARRTRQVLLEAIAVRLIDEAEPARGT